MPRKRLGVTQCENHYFMALCPGGPTLDPHEFHGTPSLPWASTEPNKLSQKQTILCEANCSPTIFIIKPFVAKRCENELISFSSVLLTRQWDESWHSSCLMCSPPVGDNLFSVSPPPSHAGLLWRIRGAGGPSPRHAIFLC